jgi:hypothetical protein
MVLGARTGLDCGLAEGKKIKSAARVIAGLISRRMVPLVLGKVGMYPAGVVKSRISRPWRDWS